MAHKLTKTLTHLSKIKALLGVTHELEVAQGYTTLGGLTTLVDQVQEMSKMTVTLLENDKGTP